MIDRNLYTLFFSDDLDNIEDLLKNNLIDINQTNFFGENALWYSINNFEKIKFLIKNGINVYNLNKNKQNAIFSLFFENFLLANMDYDHNIKKTFLSIDEDSLLTRKNNEYAIREKIRNKFKYIIDKNKKMSLIDIAVYNFNAYNYPDYEEKKKIYKFFKKSLDIRQKDIYDNTIEKYFLLEDYFLNK